MDARKMYSNPRNDLFKVILVVEILPPRAQTRADDTPKTSNGRGAFLGLRVAQNWNFSFCATCSSTAWRGRGNRGTNGRAAPLHIRGHCTPCNTCCTYSGTESLGEAGRGYWPRGSNYGIWLPETPFRLDRRAAGRYRSHGHSCPAACRRGPTSFSGNGHENGGAPALTPWPVFRPWSCGRGPWCVAW